MERFKKLPIFQEGTFPAQKNKKPTLKEFLIYQEMKLSCPKLLYFHIFIILLYFHIFIFLYFYSFYIFKKLLYVFLKISYISGENLQRPKLKNFFLKTNLYLYFYLFKFSFTFNTNFFIRTFFIRITRIIRINFYVVNNKI